MPGDFYNTLRWEQARTSALARDRNRCTVARLLGGECSDSLHVHHIEPVEERPALAYDLENLATVCSKHHPVWESLRRAVLRARDRGERKCPHRHVTAEARRLCEKRLNGDRDLVPATV